MTRILYVEHKEDSVYMVGQRLTRHGFKVSIASDGAQVIAMSFREKPDLILVDPGLPCLDGWTAARQLKQTPDTKNISIPAISAHTVPGDLDRALNAGCTAYDAKPVIFDRLLEKIVALLRGRSLP